MPTFNFTLPQLSKNPQPLLQVKELAQWVESLPIANTVGTAKSLYKMIKNINRSDILPQTRFQLTEVLARPIDHVTRALEYHYMDALFPLSYKTKHIAFICTRLAEELSFAYKWIIHSIATYNEANQTERKLFIAGIFYAIRRLSSFIYMHSLLYQAPPPNIWKELHQLFKIADANDWSSIQLTARLGMKGEEIACTMRDLYLQALLFSMASPMRLRQREMRALYLNLAQWSKAASLRHVINIVPADTKFIVQTDQDHPPQHSSLIGENNQNQTLEIDTKPLLQILQKYCDNARINDGEMPTNDHSELNVAILQRLIQSWGNAPRRYFSRTRLNFELPLVVGLSSIHNFLADAGVQRHVTHVLEKDASEFSDVNLLLADSETTGLNFTDIDRNRGLALKAKIGDDTEAIITSKDLTPAPVVWSKCDSTVSSESAITPSCVVLSTLNESVGGYCVDWSKNKVPGTKIGELVAIPSPTTPPSCALAAVRWVCDVPEHGLQVGLQILAPDIKAVTVKHKMRYEYSTIRCLLIPAAKNIKNSASLIAPPLAFRVNENDTESLIMQQNGTEKRIRLIELVESNSAFTRFRFEY